MVPAGGYAIVDVVANNPGIWSMHCHVENHTVDGMAVTLNEAQPYQNPSPPEMCQCGTLSQPSKTSMTIWTLTQTDLQPLLWAFLM